MWVPGRVVLVLVLVGALGACGAAAVEGPAPAPRPAVVAALDLLRGWDHARAAAWASGSPTALARLYAEGSPAGRADLARLDRWRSRGWRVVAMDRQVLGVRLEARSARRLVLVVTDRLVGAFAVGHGRRVALPSGDASTRRMELRRVDGRWVMLRLRTVRPRGAS